MAKKKDTLADQIDAIRADLDKRVKTHRESAKTFAVAHETSHDPAAKAKYYANFEHHMGELRKLGIHEEAHDLSEGVGRRIKNFLNHNERWAEHNQKVQTKASNLRGRSDAMKDFANRELTALAVGPSSHGTHQYIKAVRRSDKAERRADQWGDIAKDQANNKPSPKTKKWMKEETEVQEGILSKLFRHKAHKELAQKTHDKLQAFYKVGDDAGHWDLKNKDRPETKKYMKRSNQLERRNAAMHGGNAWLGKDSPRTPTDLRYMTKQRNEEEEMNLELIDALYELDLIIKEDLTEAEFQEFHESDELSEGILKKVAGAITHNEDRMKAHLDKLHKHAMWHREQALYATGKAHGAEMVMKKQQAKARTAKGLVTRYKKGQLNPAKAKGVENRMNLHHDRTEQASDRSAHYKSKAANHERQAQKWMKIKANTERKNKKGPSIKTW